MKVVVIGGAGFLGSHVAAEAAALGGRVVVVDRAPPPEEAGGIEWHEGDCSDLSVLRGALRGADLVCHFASTTNPALSWKHPEEEFSATIGLSARVFEICGECGVRKVVYPSSGGTVYGACSSGASETRLPAPANPHGIAKLAVEHFLAYYARLHDFHYDIYRISNPYGPRQPGSGRQGVVAVWMTHILNGEPLEVFGDETVLRDYIYVKDAAALMAHSFIDPASSGTYNVGSGSGTSIKQLFDSVCRVVNRPVRGEFRSRRAFDSASSLLDPGRLRALRPDVRIRPLEEGLRETWAWFQSQGRKPR